MIRHVRRVAVHIREYSTIAGHHAEHTAVLVYTVAELFHMHNVIYSLAAAVIIGGVVTWSEDILLRRRKWLMRHREEYERSRRTRPTRGGIA